MKNSNSSNEVKDSSINYKDTAMEFSPEQIKIAKIAGAILAFIALLAIVSRFVQ